MCEVSKKFRMIAYILVGALVCSTMCFSGEGSVFGELNSQTVSAAPDEGTTISGEETSTATEVSTTVPEVKTTSGVTPVKKIVPAVVKNLKTENVNTNTVTLRWNAGKNATEYWVYRSAQKKNGKMSKYKKIKTVKSKTTSFVDKGLKQATKYQYAVYSYRIVKGAKTHSKAVKVSVLTKPEAVEKVTVMKKTAKSVQVEWKKNSKASKYLVYRAEEKNNGVLGDYKYVKTVKKTKTSYTDKKITMGKIFGYKVVVQRSTGGLNSFSEGKIAKTVAPLDAPKKLKQKRVSDTSLKLTWKKVKHATEYEVYRDGKLVKRTKKASFVDKKLKNGITYEYAVKAVRNYNKKKTKSEAACIEANTSDMQDGTWVEVSIAKQMMYMYVHGKLYVKTPVVTGNAGALSTTKGVHYVRSKSSPCRLQGSYNGSSWDVTVHYWLGFTADGQGLHDSTWRSAYGGTIYKGNGSHGCVNTPLDAMKKIYSKGYIGMPVIVH